MSKLVRYSTVACCNSMIFHIDIALTLALRRWRNERLTSCQVSSSFDADVITTWIFRLVCVVRVITDILVEPHFYFVILHATWYISFHTSISIIIRTTVK